MWAAKVTAGKSPSSPASRPSTPTPVRWRGARHIAHGRAPVRRALYQAAVVAARHNEHLRPFYLRLRANGKPAKVAYVAVARKLLVFLNRILKDAPPLSA